MSEPDDHSRMPTHDQPLNAPRRKTVGPLVLTLILVGTILAIFLALTVRGNG